MVMISPLGSVGSARQPMRATTITHWLVWETSPPQDENVAVSTSTNCSLKLMLSQTGEEVYSEKNPSFVVCRDGCYAWISIATGARDRDDQSLSYLHVALECFDVDFADFAPCSILVVVRLVACHAGAPKFAAISSRGVTPLATDSYGLFGLAQ